MIKRYVYGSIKLKEFPTGYMAEVLAEYSRRMVDICDWEKLYKDILEADREALRQVILKALNAWNGLPIAEAIERIVLEAGQSPETERERLGRKLWESWPKFAATQWGEVLEDVKESYRKGAAVVRAELAKIKEEQKL